MTAKSLPSKIKAQLMKKATNKMEQNLNRQLNKMKVPFPNHLINKSIFNRRLFS